jgi:hypothetical protein
LATICIFLYCIHSNYDNILIPFKYYLGKCLLYVINLHGMPGCQHKALTTHLFEWGFPQ